MVCSKLMAALAKVSFWTDRAASPRHGERHARAEKLKRRLLFRSCKRTSRMYWKLVPKAAVLSKGRFDSQNHSLTRTSGRGR